MLHPESHAFRSPNQASSVRFRCPMAGRGGLAYRIRLYCHPALGPKAVLRARVDFVHQLRQRGKSGRCPRLLLGQRTDFEFLCSSRVLGTRHVLSILQAPWVGQPGPGAFG
jgi:hypothetical protein